jgi:hypothetical protein
MWWNRILGFFLTLILISPICYLMIWYLMIMYSWATAPRTSSVEEKFRIVEDRYGRPAEPEVILPHHDRPTTPDSIWLEAYDRAEPEAIFPHYHIWKCGHCDGRGYVHLMPPCPRCFDEGFFRYRCRTRNCDIPRRL